MGGKGASYLLFHDDVLKMFQRRVINRNSLNVSFEVITRKC